MQFLDLFGRFAKNKESLSKADLRYFVEASTSGVLEDYQIAAFLTAIYFQGLNFSQTRELTQAMCDSGEKYDFSDLDLPLVDKHSTGGIGDKVSLILAPLLASCGVLVPMMSGKGLSFTGGTIDKLHSIKGFQTQMDFKKAKKLLKDCGFFMIEQGANIVKADQIFYALRSVTGTVDSLPLITSSIVSKKMAEGTEVLIFDVKCGRGAFMKDFHQASTLGYHLAKAFASPSRTALASITNMNQPLGRNVGNFLEIQEACALLQGQREGLEDLYDLTLHLSARLLVATPLFDSYDKAYMTLENKLNQGQAYEYFLRNVALQGGEVKTLEKDLKQRKAPVIFDLKAKKSGYLSAIASDKLGYLLIQLKAGRAKQKDLIDYDTGCVFYTKLTDKIEEGQTLMRFYLRNEDQKQLVQKKALALFTLSQEPYAETLDLVQDLDV